MIHELTIFSIGILLIIVLIQYLVSKLTTKKKKKVVVLDNYQYYQNNYYLWKKDDLIVFDIIYINRGSERIFNINDLRLVACDKNSIIVIYDDNKFLVDIPIKFNDDIVLELTYLLREKLLYSGLGMEIVRIELRNETIHLRENEIKMNLLEERFNLIEEIKNEY